MPCRQRLCLTQGWLSHNGPGLFCGPQHAAPGFFAGHLVRARRHGFFARKATPGGQKVLRARRARGRKKLCA
jgi:large subunit ribosomal protein L34